MKVSKLPAKFEFKAPAARFQSTHDWEAILALGQGVRLDFEEGEKPTPAVFSRMTKSQAARRGLKVLINKTATGLAIRAVEPENDQERTEISEKWRARKERSKAAKKARKAAATAAGSNGDDDGNGDPTE